MHGIGCMAGWDHVWQGHTCMAGGVHDRGGGCMAGWGCAWQEACMAGACVAGVGHVHGRGGVYIVRSVHGRGVQGRGHAWQGGACMAGEMATAAEGMHPTGIHSCFLLHSHFPVCGIYITGKIRGEDAV